MKHIQQMIDQHGGFEHERRLRHRNTRMYFTIEDYQLYA
jgi:hypothetical protein